MEAHYDGGRRAPISSSPPSCRMGNSRDNSPYSARVNLHNVDVASTAVLTGFNYPVSGTADISVQMAGTRAHPRAQGHIRAVNASAYGEAIETFDADLHIGGERDRAQQYSSYPPGRLRFRQCRLYAGDAQFPARPDRKEFRHIANSPDPSGPLADGGPRRVYIARRGYARRAGAERIHSPERPDCSITNWRAD